MTKIVNLFGGPGISKSTTAAGVFHRLKLAGVNCELVTEFAKDKVWENNSKIFKAQPYIFGKQFWKLQRCLGEVDIIVTDSPLFLSIVYNELYYNYNHFDSFVLEIVRTMDNTNILLTRDTDRSYNPKGRNQDLIESVKIDELIESKLVLHGEQFTKISSIDAVDTILGMIS